MNNELEIFRQIISIAMDIKNSLLQGRVYREEEAQKARDLIKLLRERRRRDALAEEAMLDMDRLEAVFAKAMEKQHGPAADQCWQNAEMFARSLKQRAEAFEKDFRDF